MCSYLEFVTSFQKVFCTIVMKIHAQSSNIVYLISASIFAVHSFVELGKHLLTLDGVDFLLSDKFNQDVLEEFFSLVRGAGGTNDAPTVQAVGQIHLNLLVAGSNAVSSSKGNCKAQKRGLVLDETPLPKKRKNPRTLDL